MRGLARVGCSMRGVRVPRGAVTAGARRTSCESARRCGSVVCPSGNFAFTGTRGGMEVAAVLRGRPRPRLGAMAVGVGAGSPGARRAFCGIAEAVSGAAVGDGEHRRDAGPDDRPRRPRRVVRLAAGVGHEGCASVLSCVWCRRGPRKNLLGDSPRAERASCACGGGRRP